MSGESEEYLRAAEEHTDKFLGLVKSAIIPIGDLLCDSNNSPLPGTLQAQNASLRAEVERLKSSHTCEVCQNPIAVRTHAEIIERLRNENERLREELMRSKGQVDVTTILGGLRVVVSEFIPKDVVIISKDAEKSIDAIRALKGGEG